MRPSSSSRFVMRFTLIVRARTSRLRRERRCSRVTPFSSVVRVDVERKGPLDLGTSALRPAATCRRSRSPTITFFGSMSSSPSAASDNCMSTGRAEYTRPSWRLAAWDRRPTARHLPPADFDFAETRLGEERLRMRLPRHDLRDDIFTPLSRCLALPRARGHETARRPGESHRSTDGDRRRGSDASDCIPSERRGSTPSSGFLLQLSIMELCSHG